MPRTHGKIKIEVWDVGSDFRELSVEAQWAYEMLVSQPGLTMCGVLPYAPKKWAKLARGLTIERLEQAIAELEQGWYVVVDRDSDELLIRTFIRHDEPWKLPNLVKAARRQLREIDSQTIRDYLAERHEWLVEPMAEEIDAKTIVRIREYEKERASERRSERTLRLPLERASERASLRDPNTACARTPPAPTTTTDPAPAEEEVLSADRSETTRASLPVEKELAVAKLLEAIGKDADERTPVIVRHFAADLSEASLARVTESVHQHGGAVLNRAGYAVNALKSEANGEQPDFTEPEP